MRILFLGDASNLHNTLSHALTDMGHSCVVVSSGSTWQNTDRDIYINRENGLLGTIKYLYDITKALKWMRGFDIVQIISPHFFFLKPAKLARILEYLKRNNKHVFYSASCTDYEYFKTCHNGTIFRYSDFMIGDKPSPYVQSNEWEAHNHWHLSSVTKYQEKFIQQVDGIIACLYEYYKAYENKTPDKLCYAGIPIDIRNIRPKHIAEEPTKVKFFIGIQEAKNLLKGTDRMLEALKNLQARYPDKCEIKMVQNVPFKEYVETMRDSHVILDQLYSYTPATNALIAMAQGLVAVSGAEPEYYDFINERECKPIINVSPLIENDIYKKLEWIVQNKHELPRLSRMSREFVERHNDSHIVAQRHIDFWNKFITK